VLDGAASSLSDVNLQGIISQRHALDNSVRRLPVTDEGIHRRDNLAAMVHMAVEALFWFHPLVWWIGARLVDERERACDEDVVGRGTEPDVYAESILKTCQFYVESPLVCVSGVTGSDLKRRVEQIMKHDRHTALTALKREVVSTKVSNTASGGASYCRSSLSS